MFNQIKINYSLIRIYFIKFQRHATHNCNRLKFYIGNIIYNNCTKNDPAKLFKLQSLFLLNTLHIYFVISTPE